jgi:energy-coupling factor transport system permease protein
MDARGFDSGAVRTFAREQRVRPADLALLAGSALVAVAVPLIALAVGVFRPAY